MIFGFFVSLLNSIGAFYFYYNPAPFFSGSSISYYFFLHATFFTTLTFLFLFYFLLNKFKSYINTNQFIDGQDAAINQYNEDTKL